MTTWGYVIVFGSLGINLASLGLNIRTMRKAHKHEMHIIDRVDGLIQRARLLGYQQGYEDGSKAAK